MIDLILLGKTDQIFPRGQAAGKLADFCVLGEDIMSVPEGKIQAIPVLMTIVGGRIVFDAESGDIKTSTGPID